MMTALPFDAALRRAQDLTAQAARAHLADVGGDLADAMLYALEGGKAMRGFLVLETARLHGMPEGAAVEAALAVECLHAYSLIHDDLPCMDDDDLRRGKPTVHRKWTEHTAVLAGDALQALCFELLAGDSVGDAARRVALIAGMARAAGMDGMVGGQMMDIAAETADAPYTLAQIEAVQNGKTGALITWSATVGAVMAGADPAALRAYGDRLGLAFQIWDDVLDVEGCPHEVGKAVGKDAEAGKATFVSLLGLDAAKRRAETLVTEACDALSVYGDDAECLRQAARFVISRKT